MIGINLGDVLLSRMGMELYIIRVDSHSQANIHYLPRRKSSNGDSVATSIVVLDGYKNDENSGLVLVYTGCSGQDKLIANHRLEGGNLGLERSMF